MSVRAMHVRTVSCAAISQGNFPSPVYVVYLRGAQCDMIEQTEATVTASCVVPLDSIPESSLIQVNVEGGSVWWDLLRGSMSIDGPFNTLDIAHVECASDTMMTSSHGQCLDVGSTPMTVTIWVRGSVAVVRRAKRPGAALGPIRDVGRGRREEGSRRCGRLAP